MNLFCLSLLLPAFGLAITGHYFIAVLMLFLPVVVAMSF
jgi:hypothetical protein